MFTQARRLALWALVLVAVVGCTRSKPDPKARARQFLAAFEAAVEAGDLGEVKDHLAPGYHDDHGHDRRQMLAMLQLHLLQSRSVHALVRIQKLHVEVSGRARCTLLVAVGARPIPTAEVAESVRADAFSVQLVLDPDGDAFQIAEARWQRAGLSSFFD